MDMNEEKRKEIKDVARNAYVVGYEAGFEQGKKEARKFALALGVWAVIIAIGFILVGCSPFASYEHLSQPNVANDGYDLGCIGVEHDRGRWVVEGALCENFANSRTDTFGKVNVKLRLGGLQ
jgi:hypothetical protein